MNLKVNILKTLMSSLFYPAVLGSVFVFAVQLIVDKGFTIVVIDNFLTFAWGIVMLGYFSISYYHVLDNNDYKLYHVIFDFIEILILYFAFYLIGFIDTSIFDSPQLSKFFFLISFVPILQFVWTLFNYKNPNEAFQDKRTLVIIGLLALCACILFQLASIYLNKFNFINLLLLIVISIFILIYWSLVFTETD